MDSWRLFLPCVRAIINALFGFSTKLGKLAASSCYQHFHYFISYSFWTAKAHYFFLQVKNEWAGWSERHGVTVRHRVGIINQKKIIIRRRGIPLKKEEVSEMWKASPFHCCLLATQGFFLQPEISICQRRLLFQLK
jgi:hypothetical protein